MELMNSPIKVALTPLSWTTARMDWRVLDTMSANSGAKSRARGSYWDRKEFAVALAWRRSGFTEDREEAVEEEEEEAIVAIAWANGKSMMRSIINTSQDGFKKPPKSKQGDWIAMVHRKVRSLVQFDRQPPLWSSLPPKHFLLFLLDWHLVLLI